MIFRYLFSNIMAYAEGDFSFVADENARIMLESMHAAVTVTENWDNLKKAEPGHGGFMYPSDPELRRIMEEIRAADNNKDHSGGTYGWTVRKMEFIAKSGWATFCADYIKQQLEAKIQKLQTEHDEALLIYRAVWRRSERQTNPQVKEYYEEITRKEKCILEAASYNLREAEKERNA